MADSLAFDALEAHDAAERKQLWKLRKSGMPILLSRMSDAKHISFIEDCAVPPEHLPEFLHVRPLINTKSQTDLEAMVAISDAVTDMVIEFGGSVSGEHGDGRARTQWNRKLYGEALWQAFRDLKTVFDPDWLLNPGQVCGDVSMTENLRFDPRLRVRGRVRPVAPLGERERDAGDGRTLSRLRGLSDRTRHY